LFLQKCSPGGSLLSLFLVKNPAGTHASHALIEAPSSRLQPTSYFDPCTNHLQHTFIMRINHGKKTAKKEKILPVMWGYPEMQRPALTSQYGYKKTLLIDHKTCSPQLPGL
jgi:hypothetical protein